MRRIPLTISETPARGCRERRAWLSPARLFRLGVVATTIAGFLLALVLAASPELHERLHHDCDEDHEHQDHHECLATVLHAGGCDSTTPATPLANCVAIVVETRQVDRSFPVDSLYLRFRILEHAPPRRA